MPKPQTTNRLWTGYHKQQQPKYQVLPRGARKKGDDNQMRSKVQAESKQMEEKLLALGLDKEELDKLSPERQQELLDNLTLLRLAYYELSEAV